MDYCSKFTEISLISTKTATSVIIHLRSICARHEIPDELVADDRPFASPELQNFGTSWGFKTTTSSPRYPQSNGMTERAE